MPLLQGPRVTLRPLTEQDLPALHHALYGEVQPEWKRHDAPYFPLRPLGYTEFEQHWQRFVKGDTSRHAIDIDGALRGTVSRYWEDEGNVWLEAGIVIYDPAYWNRGYGREALTLWVTHLFHTLPVPRVGLTTWSGNPRMVHVALRLGFQLEGRIRRVRSWQGEYHDSIRLGVLREEWRHGD